METDNKKIVSVTQELAEFVQDGNLGYKKAAEETKDENFKKFCLEQAKKRSNFLNELNEIIKKYGGEPETSGTIKGAIFRKWMDVKTSLINKDEEAVIGSCIYGEEWAQKAFDEALSTPDLPQEVKDVFEHQRLISQKAITELEALKFHYEK